MSREGPMSFVPTIERSSSLQKIATPVAADTVVRTSTTVVSRPSRSVISFGAPTTGSPAGGASAARADPVPRTPHAATPIAPSTRAMPLLMEVPPVRRPPTLPPPGKGETDAETPVGLGAAAVVAASLHGDSIERRRAGHQVRASGQHARAGLAPLRAERDRGETLRAVLHRGGRGL